MYTKKQLFPHPDVIHSHFYAINKRTLSLFELLCNTWLVLSLKVQSVIGPTWKINRVTTALLFTFYCSRRAERTWSRRTNENCQFLVLDSWPASITDKYFYCRIFYSCKMKTNQLFEGYCSNLLNTFVDPSILIYIYINQNQ